MRRQDHEKYNQCVQLYLKRNLVELKRALKGRELNQFEKCLLRARLLNLDGEFEKAKELLLKQNTQSYFLLAQRGNVLSSIYDKSSSYQMAAASNHEAIINYLKLDDREGLYISYLNLSINYSRLSLKPLFEFAWEKAFSYRNNSSQTLYLIRSKSSYLAKEGKINEALDLMLEYSVRDLIKEEQNYIVHQNLIADLYFRLKRYEKSLEIYSELFKKSKTLTRERIQYEYKITVAIYQKTKLESIPTKFSKDSEYFYLWKCLLFLQDGEPELAQSFWSKLVAMNPDKYVEGFKFKDFGDMNNHFSQFLALLRPDNIEGINPFKVNTKAYRFFDVLKASETPLRKEVLIERIWDVSYDPDFDSRFYKLVERVKKQGVSLVMKNSTYQLCL